MTHGLPRHGRTRQAVELKVKEDEHQIIREILATCSTKAARIFARQEQRHKLDVLAEESGMLDQCRCLARSHVAMMFDAFCRLGHSVSLDAAAREMGIKGKTEGMTGAVAPVLWAQGRREELLRYVAQDTKTTLDLATACEACGDLRWVSRSGMTRSMPLPRKWLAVSAALEPPLPDTSWMESPWSRERFAGWMGILDRR
jgi:hypothetical protein